MFFYPHKLRRHVIATGIRITLLLAVSAALAMVAVRAWSAKPTKHDQEMQVLRAQKERVSRLVDANEKLREQVEKKYPMEFDEFHLNGKRLMRCLDVFCMSVCREPDFDPPVCEE